jgi:hypothetical protein
MAGNAGTVVSAMETEGTPLKLLHLQILPQRLDPLGLQHGRAMSTEKGAAAPSPQKGSSASSSGS